MQLLVLDDERQIVSLVGAVARDLGWKVETALDIPAFHAALGAHKPDLIMLDLQLGPSDGIEQLRYLRGQSFGGQIILMSGVDTRVLAAARQLGESLGLSIRGVMSKPARVADLRKLLREAALPLESRQAAKKFGAGLGVAPGELERLTSADVGSALGGSQIHLALQPLVSASTGKIVKFEALIRWTHPQLGIIPPDRFIPLAEQDEAVIDRLTSWVVRTAIDHHKHLATNFASLPIAVNVSGINLRRLDFPDLVSSLIAEGGLPPSALHFEITESVAAKDPKATADILTRLRLKGFALAMDDFGTGYSSLEALREMPFSELKIDKSYILNMIESRDSYAIVKSVVGLATNMGLETVAEGVETAELACLLQELGVTCLQGYHIAKPMAIHHALDWSKSWGGEPLWLADQPRFVQR
jgi:EAL domain-containing protein (putative c-di-GMP-specific phosphodiesterase class I)/ActR/RegA family two-component response regulator